MDHLPYPDDAQYPPVDIPYLLTPSIPRYDGLGFINFASRSGWQVGGLQWYECDALMAAQRAQSWLYLGFLSEFFSDAIKESDVVTTRDNSKFISTSKKLPGLLSRWSGKRRWRLLECAARIILEMLVSVCTIGIVLLLPRRPWVERHFRPASRLSVSSLAVLKEVESQIRELEQHHAESTDVMLTCLAIRALLWSVRNAAANRDEDILKKQKFELSPSPYLKALLLERGFCLHELKWIQRSCSVATLHYLSAYSHRGPQHDDCSAERCVAYILEEQSYTTEHTSEGCECAMVRVELDKLKNIIDSGHIPIVVVSTSVDKLQLEVCPASLSVPYTAISHAWAGGLGNPRTSSLPTCQVRQIASILQPLSQSRLLEPLFFSATKSNGEITPTDQPEVACCAFWMDTLCIPTRSEVTPGSDTRIKALSPMNRIYAEAAHVVVLDNTLKGGLHDSGLQFASTIFTSSWMTRCWTYLEGRLAQNLQVVLNDQLQDPFVLRDRVARRSALFERYLFIWDDAFQLQRELASSLNKLRSMKESPVGFGQLENFIESWNELLRRTTSRPSDLLIIFALMLDLSVYEAELITSPELRLMGILKTQKRLPMSFLFEGAAPGYRVNEHCGWLPQKMRMIVDRSSGWLIRLKDPRTNQHYFRVVAVLGAAYVVRVKSAAAAGILRLRARSTVLPELVLRVHISSLEDAACNTNAEADARLGWVYIIPKLSHNGTAAASKTGYGCRFRVLEEHKKSLLLSYDQAISYEVISGPGPVSTLTPNEASAVVEGQSHDTKKELRLQSDWDTWPALDYQRSIGGRPMTTKHAPTHPFVGVLAFFELMLMITTAMIIVVVFPNAEVFASDFWWTAAPAEWSMWGLSILALFVKVAVLLKIELPTLGKRLKAVEFERWAKSFDHKEPRETQTDVRLPLSQLYQYHSWPVVFLVVSVSCTLLVVGVRVDRPMLYDLAILGGSLLIEVVVRISAEMLWRLPLLRPYRVRAIKSIQNEYPEGLPPLYPWKFFAKPNLFTHSSSGLDELFKNPLYLPDGFMRGR